MASHYFDFAATSAIRPPAVVEAVERFLSECGATPGRGAYERSLEAGRTALRCRRRLAELLDLPGDSGRLAFTFNATHAINVALRGLLRPGDAVVVSQYDHNAVLRPVHLLAAELELEVRMLSGTPDGGVDEAELERLLEGARLVTVNGASNVIGNAMPLGRIAERARTAGCLVLLDAAQSAGQIPGRPAHEGADLVALTGHKALLGPQGTGALWVREGLDVRPTLAGGGGDRSQDRTMPEAMPDRLEAGTLNAPGIAGLAAACAYLLERTVEDVHASEMRLKRRLHEGLSSLAGVRVASPLALDGAPIVTITVRGHDPSSVASLLDRRFGIAVRSGLHCAPEAHRVLGTEHGAVRFSLGWSTTEEDVDAAIAAVDALARPAQVSAAAPHEGNGACASS